MMRLNLGGDYILPGPTRTGAEHAEPPAQSPQVGLGAPADPDAFRRWPQIHNIRTLNVAGPREGESPGVYASARAWLPAVI